MRVLLVEDSDRLRELMAAGLRQAGYVVDEVSSLRQARAAVEVSRFDLLLLDLGLPDGDGVVWLGELRRAGNQVPVVAVTARAESGARIAGLDTGADDYIVKPFVFAELLARCRAALRRPFPVHSVRLAIGNLEFDTVGRLSQVGQSPLPLPPRETALLEALLRRAGKVVPRETIADALYNFDDACTPNAIEAHVSRLRRHLAEARATVDIHTVRGVGYLLREQRQ
jgi:DNA-binding response OmpR family regulator